VIISSSGPKVKLGASIKRAGRSYAKSTPHCGKNTGEKPALRETRVTNPRVGADYRNCFKTRETAEKAVR